jgi:hypothetical protein
MAFLFFKENYEIPPPVTIQTPSPSLLQPELTSPSSLTISTIFSDIADRYQTYMSENPASPVIIKYKDIYENIFDSINQLRVFDTTELMSFFSTLQNTHLAAYREIISTLTPPLYSNTPSPLYSNTPPPEVDVTTAYNNYCTAVVTLFGTSYAVMCVNLYNAYLINRNSQQVDSSFLIFSNDCLADAKRPFDFDTYKKSSMLTTLIDAQIAMIRSQYQLDSTVIPDLKNKFAKAYFNMIQPKKTIWDAITTNTTNINAISTKIALNYFQFYNYLFFSIDRVQRSICSNNGYTLKQLESNLNAARNTSSDMIYQMQKMFNDCVVYNPTPTPNP